MPVPDAEHLEVEQRFEANGRRIAYPRDEIELEGRRVAGPGGPLDAVLGAAQRLGERAVARVDGCDDRRFVPAAAVEQLVDVEMGGERLEVDRGPQPEELRVGHRGTRWAALADRAHTPRAVTRSPRLARLEVVHLAVNLDPALPSAEWGEARVVEHHPHAHLL